MSYIWSTKRPKPYTAVGVRRLRCCRCDAPAVHQWQVCSDGNNWRPLCLECDIQLNEMVLAWFGHPDAQALASKYREEQWAEENAYITANG